MIAAFGSNRREHCLRSFKRGSALSGLILSWNGTLSLTINSTLARFKRQPFEALSTNETDLELQVGLICGRPQKPKRNSRSNVQSVRSRCAPIIPLSLTCNFQLLLIASLSHRLLEHCRRQRSTTASWNVITGFRCFSGFLLGWVAAEHVLLFHQHQGRETTRQRWEKTSSALDAH